MPEPSLDLTELVRAEAARTGPPPTFSTLQARSRRRRRVRVASGVTALTLVITALAVGPSVLATHRSSETQPAVAPLPPLPRTWKSRAEAQQNADCMARSGYTYRPTARRWLGPGPTPDSYFWPGQGALQLNGKGFSFSIPSPEWDTYQQTIQKCAREVGYAYTIPSYNPAPTAEAGCMNVRDEPTGTEIASGDAQGKHWTAKVYQASGTACFGYALGGKLAGSLVVADDPGASTETDPLAPGIKGGDWLFYGIAPRQVTRVVYTVDGTQHTATATAPPGSDHAFFALAVPITGTTRYTGAWYDDTGHVVTQVTGTT